MKRLISCSILAGAMVVGTGGLLAQEGSAPKVSGPDQIDPHRETGKSYKKGSKKKSTTVDSSKTGQSHRLGNSGDLTKNGSDVNGKRAEGSDKQAAGNSASKPNHD